MRYCYPKHITIMFSIIYLQYYHNLVDSIWDKVSCDLHGPTTVYRYVHGACPIDLNKPNVACQLPIRLKPAPSSLGMDMQ